MSGGYLLGNFRKSKVNGLSVWVLEFIDLSVWLFLVFQWSVYLHILKISIKCERKVPPLKTFKIEREGSPLWNFKQLMIVSLCFWEYFYFKLKPPVSQVGYINRGLCFICLSYYHRCQRLFRTDKGSVLPLWQLFFSQKVFIQFVDFYLAAFQPTTGISDP